MCGIVGYIGKRQAAPLLVECLSKLEYRGYDSAGVAIINEKGINIEKCKGRLKNLEEKLNQSPIEGTMGIGHTRWATHGEPSDVNSHPHYNKDMTISVVHNGIIENYLELREWLQTLGYEFKSETDTEVVPHLIDYFYEGDIVKAVMKALDKIEGSYALGVVCSHEPDKMVAVRKDSPLIVGLGEGENFIASDIPAILAYTRDVYLLNDKEIVVLTRDKVEIMTKEGLPVQKEVFHVTWDAEAAEKGGYEHFMIKEIHEQPKAIRDTLTRRIVADSDEIVLDDIKLTAEDLKNIDKIYIVACGTAYHAGLVGKYVIEKLARIPVEVDIASEFRYRDPIINERTLMMVISQSGETADTLAALREAKNRGARVIAITNVVGSSVAREADDILYTWAGPEIAVASTKAYVTQLIAIYIVALYLARLNGKMTVEEYRVIRDELLKLPEKAEEVLNRKEEIQKFAAKNYGHKDIFYLGRGLDFAVALEGALKIKEISYIHAEAYAAGELKHGPIALIDKGVPVIALATQEDLFEKMVSNIKEVVTRGAKVLGVAFDGHEDIEKVVDQTVYIPKTLPLLAPVLSVIPLQLLSYYTAVERGCDVDKPRNLAKSVTVE
ncbi:glutamine--fructose-6-phosphate transaminase (isomerizing) [Thermobrachium celere]|uniref:Glutamine--fructose-6-phosphate aminotransferase [isomerizing] n=1 Tax=Thermobrachium celere DSM 8682 TaxID=941824 RepID=R7RR01_9CLOT|nr:glutamine--fructose-6-phosphate transaminase (isomerizing) [Thermobrachium celere]GFR35978.1 glutamine--fructose-6-phosphate aminotransferase [isomerizing] [Thermobrachium celere]CDF57685.1 Glucosamine--fructose-6-phosphate aminotransferase [isomerizing] [Thermobrachium celere DSM 8682]